MRRNLYVLAVMFFILNLVITAILLLSFHRGYYTKTYENLNTAQEIGISEADLTEATDVLLDYIQGRRPDLDVSVTLNGQEVAMFNQREIDHMVDVKDLYRNVVDFRGITMIFVAVMLVISLGTGDYLDMKLNRDSLAVALSCLAILFAAIGLFALIDFNSFWIMFHELIFTNDLWLLNPMTDRLIMMVPEAFFMGLVYRIILAVVLIIIVCAVAYGILDRVVKRNVTRRSV